MLSLHEWHWVWEEVKDLVQGGVIQRIYEEDVHTRYLQVRAPGVTHLLMLNTHPELGRFHMVDRRPKQPKRPSTMTMFMRKWLKGMRVEQIDANEGDRIVRFCGHVADPNWFPADEDDKDARPRRVAVELCFEALGRHMNLFVLDAEHKILAQLQRDSVPERRLRVGGAYCLPQARDEVAHRTLLKHRWPDATVLEDVKAPRSWLVAQEYAKRDEAWRFEVCKRTLGVRLKRAIKRAKKLVQNIERDLERAEDAKVFRRYGELLQSAYGKIERGASIATVPDYYEEGMPQVSIALNPAIDLNANIAAYFKQYRRMSDAIGMIEARLLNGMARLELMQKSRADLELCTTLDDIEQLAQKLEHANVLRPEMQGIQKQTSGPRSVLKKKLPYRAFTGKRGGSILVGRGSKGNDELSIKIARGRDLWFHARDWAGAHVILRVDKNSMPHQADIQDAAMLAAHFSKGAKDTHVDVTYTEAKHIRKPKGAAPGRVTVAGGSTISVTIDDDRIAELCVS